MQMPITKPHLSKLMYILQRLLGWPATWLFAPASFSTLFHSTFNQIISFRLAFFHLYLPFHLTLFLGFELEHIFKFVIFVQARILSLFCECRSIYAPHCYVRSSTVVYWIKQQYMVCCPNIMPAYTVKLIEHFFQTGRRIFLSCLSV